MRFAAWFIDRVLYGLLFMVPLVIGVGLIRSRWRPRRRHHRRGCHRGVRVSTAISSAAPARPGAALLRGIKVVDLTTGDTIGFGRAVARTMFAEFISAAIFYLGYLWMLWDSDHQTWHDKVGSTTVVKA